MRTSFLSSTRWAVAVLAATFSVATLNAQTVFSDNFQYANPNNPPPFTSTYTQVSNNLINGMQAAGVYSITPDLARDLGGGQTQHPAIAPANGANLQNFYDHTFGNANGLYLAINAAAATTIYGANNIAVTPNTDYFFSVWLNSWTYAGSPTFGRIDVRLQGNNSAIGSIGFADAPPTTSDYQSWGRTENWTQTILAFNSGNNTSINLDILNVNTEADGNDYSVDDISIFVAVPEPGAIALGSLGAIGIGAAVYSKLQARRRRKLAIQKKAVLQQA